MENGEERILTECEQVNTVEYKDDGKVLFTEHGGPDCLEVYTSESDYTLTGSSIETSYGITTEVSQINVLSENVLEIEFDENGIPIIVEYKKLD